MSELSAPDLGVQDGFNFACHMKYHSSHPSLIPLGSYTYQLQNFLLDSCRAYFAATSLQIRLKKPPNQFSTESVS